MEKARVYYTLSISRGGGPRPPGPPPPRFATANIPTEVLPYWPYKDEIGYYNGILLKCDRVIIPNSLIGEVLKDIHRGHIGIEKCRLRARRSVFWPNMNVDIAKIINQCELCQVHGGPQTKTYTYNMNESSALCRNRSL